MSSQTSSQTIDDVILRVAEAVGSLMEFWGFKRNMGRIWTLLYLETEPQSAAQIGQRLSLSSGAVSMLLAELTHWGAVKKAWKPDSRRDHYQSETNIWKMISRVLRERELRKVAESIEIFEEALVILAHLKEQGVPEHSDRRMVHIRGHVDGLLVLARIGKRLLETILSGQSVDASPLKYFDSDKPEK